MAGFEPGTLRLIQVNPLPIILTFTKGVSRRRSYSVQLHCNSVTELTLITWSWEGLVCGLNIVIGLTSCGLMTEFTSCGILLLLL